MSIHSRRARNTRPAGGLVPRRDRLAGDERNLWWFTDTLAAELRASLDPHGVFALPRSVQPRA